MPSPKDLFIYVLLLFWIFVNAIHKSIRCQTSRGWLCRQSAIYSFPRYPSQKSYSCCVLSLINSYLCCESRFMTRRNIARCYWRPQKLCLVILASTGHYLEILVAAKTESGGISSGSSG